MRQLIPLFLHTDKRGVGFCFVVVLAEEGGGGLRGRGREGMREANSLTVRDFCVRLL